MNKIDMYCKVINQIENLYEQFAKKHNITYTKLAVLSEVYKNDKVSQKHISDTWMLPKQTVNNEVLSLYKEKSIDFINDDSDKRFKKIIFTSSGYDKYKHIVKELNDIENKVLAKASDELLNRIYEAAGELKTIMEECFNEK